MQYNPVQEAKTPSLPRSLKIVNKSITPTPKPVQFVTIPMIFCQVQPCSEHIQLLSINKLPGNFLSTGNQNVNLTQVSVPPSEELSKIETVIIDEPEDLSQYL